MLKSSEGCSQDISSYTFYSSAVIQKITAKEEVQINYKRLDPFLRWLGQHTIFQNL